jgi:hypothetical protein
MFSAWTNLRALLVNYPDDEMLVNYPGNEDAGELSRGRGCW